MKKVEILCDQCQDDLTYTSNCDDYRLSLRSEALEHRDSTLPVTLMAKFPDIEREHHFCGLTCLKRWVAAR